MYPVVLITHFTETKPGNKENNKEEDSSKTKTEEQQEDEEAEEMEPEPDTTLYVKNLNFDSTEESIKKVLKSGF